MDNLENRRDVRILIVEDDMVNRLILRTMLEKTGYTVLEAADGTRALEILRDSPSFDLIFMDKQMPGMDGLQTLKAIRNDLGITTPVYIVSGEQPLSEAPSSPQDPDGYVTKPYRMEDLESVIQIVRTRSGR